MDDHLAESLQSLTVELDKMMARTPGPLTCGKGCSACCYEAVYATRAEARLIVDFVRAQGPAAVDALRAEVNAWMRKFMLSDLWDVHMPEIVAYRSMRLKCPLLASDGTCGVYEVRPVGCRMHMTKEPVRMCEDLTMRGRAKYVDPLATALEFGHTNVVFALNEAMLAARGDDEVLTTEHLVVLLADALGMPAPPSGSRVNWPTTMPQGLHA